MNKFLQKYLELQKERFDLLGQIKHQKQEENVYVQYGGRKRKKH